MRVPSAPGNESLESVFDYLSVASRRSDARFTSELMAYLEGDFGRFLLTLDLIPERTGSLLEIGADPYFTTLLIERFRDYEMVLANGGSDTRGTKDIIGSGTPYERTMECIVLNVEGDELPFEAETFDVVLFCEVLEHLTMDPMKALSNLNRVLKPGGTLVLTTPNATRAHVAADLVAGKNTNDKYSAYGPYGRHNREYVLWEVRDILARSGFEVKALFASDFEVQRSGVPVNNRNLKRRLFDAALSAVRGGQDDMGFTIFCSAVKIGAPSSKKPRWLYRSYPEDELSD